MLRIMVFAILLTAIASADEGVRSLRVPLAGQEFNAIGQSWPGIGCWFWHEDEFAPEGYKAFLDAYEKHTGFGLLTTSIRHPVEVTAPEVHDQIKRAAVYAKEKGMGIVMDLDVRLARQAFRDAHPGELQELVRLRETALPVSGECELNIESIGFGDHYTFQATNYVPLSSRLVRVYSYAKKDGLIMGDTVEDVTERCRIIESSEKGLHVGLPCTPADAGRTACVMAAFTLFTPDVFAPHLIEFERGILEQYADVPLAGACKDEWGFPGRFELRNDDLWFSRFMAEAYAHRRPGRDLVRDLLLMSMGEQERVAERAAAINHYMEMNWQRNGELESAFYDSVKEVIGQEAMVGTHPTWYAYPGEKEAFKNGLSWWASKRDLAQTDEATPFAARTALAKKWQSPLWYNMYYSDDIHDYENDLWRHVLGGGRMNFHPLWPHDWETINDSLLSGDMMRAECRARLLNYISTAPVDCPVAVIFGHPSTLNWAGVGFGDAGLSVTDALWEKGQYADLVPSSEIASGALTIDDDGLLRYGPQTYVAAVLYHPQYERPEVAGLFRRLAEKQQTALFRVGPWTRDFEGLAFDGNSALPEEMAAVDTASCINAVLNHLKTKGIEPQTPGDLHNVGGYPKSAMPLPKGRCRLLDDTVIIASGQDKVLGDPIRETIQIGDKTVFVDAVGLAAVRLDKHGAVEALCAGGLKSFQSDKLSLELDTPADVALWRADNGAWRGVWQGETTEIPPALLEVSLNWRRLRLPEPYSP